MLRASSRRLFGDQQLFGASQLPVVDSSSILNWFEELKAKVPAGGAGK